MVVLHSANTVGDDSRTVAALKECKRERDRNRFASMTEEQRSQINKKRRDSYQRRKGRHVQAETSKDGHVPSINDNKENYGTQFDDAKDNSDWLHRSDSYGFQTFDNESSSMRRSPDASPFGELSANIVADDSRKETDLRERKRARDRARYAAMTDEQRSQMNKKRRDSKQQRKRQPVQAETSNDGNVPSIDDSKKNSGTEFQDDEDNSDWPHRSGTYGVQTSDNENSSIRTPRNFRVRRGAGSDGMVRAAVWLSVRIRVQPADNAHGGRAELAAARREAAPSSWDFILSSRERHAKRPPSSHTVIICRQ